MTKHSIKKFLNESTYLGLSFRNRKYISSYFRFFDNFFSLFMAYLTRFLNLNFLSTEFLNVYLIYTFISFSVIFFFKLYEYPIHSQDQDIFLKIDFVIVIIFLATSFIFYERSIIARSIPFIALIINLFFNNKQIYFKKFIQKIDQIHNYKTVYYWE